METLNDFINSTELNLMPSNAIEINLVEAQTKLFPGAHICTKSEEGSICHHGIVLDLINGVTIAHFWGNNDKSDAKLQETSLSIFSRGLPGSSPSDYRPIFLVQYENDNEERRKQTVASAKELLRDASKISYNLLTSNCECFATYCRTGHWKSDQVIKSLKWVLQRIPMAQACIDGYSASVNASFKMKHEKSFPKK